MEKWTKGDDKEESTLREGVSEFRKRGCNAGSEKKSQPDSSPRKD